MTDAERAAWRDFLEQAQSSALIALARVQADTEIDLEEAASLVTGAFAAAASKIGVEL